MFEVIKIGRDTMIEQLTQSTFDHIQQVPETLDFYLKYGFKGFENFSNEELIIEYKDYVSEDPEAYIQIILEEEND